MLSVLRTVIFAAGFAATSAMAQTATYDFTGTVTSASGSVGNIAPGSTVTGTVTLNLAAAIPSQSTNFPGDPNAAWGVEQFAGPPFPFAVPSTPLVSETLSGPNFSFQAGALGGVEAVNAEVLAGPGYYTASTSLESLAGSFYGEGIHLYAATPGLELYGPNGLLKLPAGATVFGSGSIASGIYANGAPSLTIMYNIDSVSLAPAVPELPAAFMLLAGIIALTVIWKSSRGQVARPQGAGG